MPAYLYPVANVLGTLPIVPLWVSAVRITGGAGPLFLRTHLPGDVDLGTRDVAVHVDAAGHDHQPAGVDRRAAARTCRIGRRGDDLAVFDPEIAHLAVDPVGRIVDRAAGDFEE